MSRFKIYCPGCGRVIFESRYASASFLERKCNKCKKLVVYDPDTGRVVMKRVPPRNCSSGMRFY